MSLQKFQVEIVLKALEAQSIKPSGICSDSRQVKAGDVFLAYPGDESDGRLYIESAVNNGAAAVLWEAEFAPEISITVPNLAVRGLRDLAGHIADQVYVQPSRQLWTAGVTGTNGKTSVSQWLAQALTLLGRSCALVGTLGNGFPGALVETGNTTPDAVVLHRDLAGFVAAGAKACALEVSSIGVDQGRVNGVHFDAAIFTNLTRDHLDYHGDMEAYALAKAAFFQLPQIGCAVINLDDPFGLELVAQVRGRMRCIGYSLATVAPQVEVDELLHAEALNLSGKGLSMCVGGAVIEAALIGRFNAANVLAVLGALRAAGFSLAEAATAIAQLTPPPGRMQAQAGQGKPLVVVDYAHTPDALEQVLITLRETAQERGGKLICVFGCGGDRDPGKRPLMGEVVARLSDVCVVTSDNPRSENAAAIIAAVCAGISAARVDLSRTEVDRAVAIRQSIAQARASDIVLIAGKGHEEYQEIAGVRHVFSDYSEAQSALEQWT